MDNVLVCCIGNVFNSNLYCMLKEICYPVVFFDCNYEDSDISFTDMADTYPINYESEESFINSILKIMPVSDVVILSQVYLCEGKNIQYKLDELLRKMFISIKCMYKPLMRQRQGKVWVIEPQLECPEHCFPELESLIRGVRTGMKALTKIAALELARKNINFNYISGEVDEFKIRRILEWSLKSKTIFLTAQELAT